MDATTEVSRLPLTSADPLAERLAQLRALFPEAAGEGKCDLEKLRALLGEGAARGDERERYGLSWAGKSDALKAIRTRTTATLLPAPGESVSWDATGHAIIEGDNLEVLKVLQTAYYGQVKLIYIDPPYNTGGDFIYPDDYAEGLGSYLTYLGQVKDGVKQTTNLDTSGRYHSRWLTMIYPRLFLARNLLREDGVIFVSIDDHEVSNLRMVMDEVFGEENFIECIIWRKRSTPPNDKVIGANHDYIIAYARDVSAVKLNLRERGAERLADFKNPDTHPKGPWVAGDLTANVKGGRFVQSLYYPIVNPSTGKEHYPGTEASKGNYRFNAAEMQNLLANNEIYFGKDGTKAPKLKRFLCDVKAGMSYPTIWDFVPLNSQGSEEMDEHFRDSTIFENPKPSGLVKELVRLGASSDGLVLDFFGGSGTTAQAVMEVNREDGGNRRFMLVQLPEPTGREDFSTIAELTKERVRRVIAKMGKEQTAATEVEQASTAILPGMDAPAESPRHPADLGFKVFKLAESNFAIWNPALAATDPEALAKQWQLTADNVRADASETALLYELMLKASPRDWLPLQTPPTAVDVAGARAWMLGGDRLLLCLARELTREQLRAMIDLQPQSVLCLDVAFKGNDALKVNADLEFQSHNIKFATA